MIKKVESSNTGPAYRLADEKTGQTFKSLIAPHLMKLCLADVRADLQQRLSPTPAAGPGPPPSQPSVSAGPAIATNQPDVNTTTAAVQGSRTQPRNKFEPAVKILRQKKGQRAKCYI